MCGRVTTPWRRAKATHLPHATQHDAPSGDVHRQNVPVASEPAVRGATFAEVFGVSEFRVFWLAQAVLVYDRTHSPLLTATAYAAGFLPWVVGGVLFGTVADRWPRREVMVG